jgi:hypothetical protein
MPASRRVLSQQTTFEVVRDDFGEQHDIYDYQLEKI